MADMTSSMVALLMFFARRCFNERNRGSSRNAASSHDVNADPPCQADFAKRRRGRYRNVAAIAMLSLFFWANGHLRTCAVPRMRPCPHRFYYPALVGNASQSVQIGAYCPFLVAGRATRVEVRSRGSQRLSNRSGAHSVHSMGPCVAHWTRWVSLGWTWA